MKKDIEIQEDVISQLKWEPFLKASDIGVVVKKWHRHTFGNSCKL